MAGFLPLALFMENLFVIQNLEFGGEWHRVGWLKGDRIGG